MTHVSILRLPALLAALALSTAALAALPGAGTRAAPSAAAPDPVAWMRDAPQSSTRPSLRDALMGGARSDPNVPAPGASGCHLQCTPWYGCQWVCTLPE